MDHALDYEIRVDGCCEAETNSLVEALRYFEQYKRDGERVELLEVKTIKAQDNPGFDRAAWLKRAVAGG